MKFVLYTNALSAHQIPLAREIVKLAGADNFRYVYTSKEGQKLQESNATEGWIEFLPIEETNERLENADVMLVGGIRPIDLCERRAASGKITFYMSERWFKPPIGMFRLLVPSYRRMAKRFVRLLDVGGITYLPIGIHAARDMARLYGLVHGDWRCLFRAPELDSERKPGGKIWLKNNHAEHVAHVDKKYCLDKMRMWGYFVEPSRFPHLNYQTQTPSSSTQLTQSQLKTHNSLKVLWVGRLLKLKRVDTIIRAVGELSRLNASLPPTPTRNSNSVPSNSNSNLQLSLDIYGTGPEESKLKRLAAKYVNIINFYPPVPIDDVRKLMREHDIYVLASNAYEGWGAVVSEALEEGMKVVGTFEAGSSATILPKESLFHAGDWKGLLKLLQNGAPRVGIGEWTAKGAAEVMKG